MRLIIILLFFLVLWSLNDFILVSSQDQEVEQPLQNNVTTTVNNGNGIDIIIEEEVEDGNGTDIIIEEEVEEDPLDVLGEPDWTRLRPGWSLTVNDQCLYEFVFELVHDPTLPVGDDAYNGRCEYGESIPPKIAPEDGEPYLNPRQMWEQFPSYVWATMGFNHLSVDFLPCGRRPKGYTTPQYDFSFFRVTPEYRAETMVCEVIPDDEGAVPGEQICLSQQEEPNGMKFFIVPSAMVNRIPVVNMPTEFERPDHGYGPIPHYGLRSWDQSIVPDSPREWNDVPIFMSSYDGNPIMWQAHVPYKMVSGYESQFHSGAARYFETTIQTLPDSWSVHYDTKKDGGRIRFTLVGKAGICRDDFKRAEEAAGGPPSFGTSTEKEEEQQGQDEDGPERGDEDSTIEEDSSSANNRRRSIFTFGNIINMIATIRIVLSLLVCV